MQTIFQWQVNQLFSKVFVYLLILSPSRDHRVPTSELQVLFIDCETETLEQIQSYALTLTFLTHLRFLIKTVDFEIANYYFSYQ